MGRLYGGNLVGALRLTYFFCVVHFDGLFLPGQGEGGAVGASKLPTPLRLVGRSVGRSVGWLVGRKRMV